MKLHYSDAIGPEIAPHIERLAELRTVVFREYPYLYDGTLEYERQYMQKLADSPHGYLVLAKDGQTVVGASTGLPLSDAEPHFQKPFLEAGLDVDDFFYFGESVVLPDYRGQGAGHKFFDERIAQAHFLAFPFSCFCAFVRATNHPDKPKDYRSLDKFWKKRGFKQRADLQTSFPWPDLGQTEPTDKLMEFWVRREEAEF
jgi:GNAT superfamily N-acetyltransferase